MRPSGNLVLLCFRNYSLKANILEDNIFEVEDANDKNDPNGDVQKRKKNNFIQFGKKKIVNEAYAAPNSVKLTARKYGVQGNQIRKWQNNTIALGDLPAYPTLRTVEERGIIWAAKNNVTVHKGPNSMIPDDVANHIIQFFEQLRERGISVCSQLLAIELQRFSPQLNQLSVAFLCHCVLHLMKRNNVSHWCVTHKAQNIHFEQPIIVDFTRHINWQIVSGRYSANVIINVDETNVDFDPSPRTTLCRIGEWSVKARISGHSGCCTVVLACTIADLNYLHW